MLVLGGLRGSIESVRFSPDGRRVAAGGAGRVAGVWDVGTAGTPHRLPSGRVTDLRFGRDGSTVFTAGPLAALAFDLGDPTNRGRPVRPYTERLDRSDDGRRLALTGRFDLSLSGQRAAVLDVPADGSPRPLWADPPEREGVLIWGLAWLPGADRLAVAEWRGSYPNHRAWLAIRDGATGAEVASRQRDGLPTDRLAAAADGTLAAAAGACLFAWPGGDLAGDPVVVRSDTRMHFTGMAFHPSGRYLAATSNDATVKLYDTASWQLATSFTWDVGRLRSVAFSPDGTLAAVGSDTGRVVVWDVDL